jgi:Na+-translocating ferredoxin:NAD+ oxidoreductase subunit B
LATDVLTLVTCPLTGFPVFSVKLFSYKMESGKGAAMDVEVYCQLAKRLDAIPNGFPKTASGVELRLLAKIFTREEASLAAAMHMRQEPASEIAARAGAETERAYKVLKDMARKGLVRIKKGKGELGFGLMPFVVGFYEEQLPRMDAELAQLLEQYLVETRGWTSVQGPSVHRVIPVGEAVPFHLEVFAHEQASALLEGARSWAVRDCICRVQQDLVGKGCDMPREACLIFAPIENAFDNDPAARRLSKGEAFEILKQAEAAGLVHTTGNYRDGHFYICNCCPCCCGVLRGLTEFEIPTAIASSGFYSQVDTELCSGCGDCLERCHFGALSIPDFTCEVELSRCVGCGLCATACSTGALRLERREGYASPPADLKEWMVKRATARGISMGDLL